MTLTIILVLLAIAVAWPYLAEYRRKPMDARTRSTAPGAFADLSQGRTHFEWSGPLRGPVAVCVHGLTTPSFVWQGVARGLAALGYRVLVYDLYGRGYSDRTDGVQDHGFFVQQLEDLLADQGVGDDFTLLGYSMGGAIATAFTARHPDRVRQLILIAAAGMGVRPGRMISVIRGTPVLDGWLMLALFPRLHRKSTELERPLPSSVDNIVDLQQRELEFRGYVPAILASSRGNMGRLLHDEHQAIHRAGVPVLAIWGREDTVVPLSAMGNLTEWSRAAQQEVIDGAGHGLPYTHTDEVIDALRETLRDGLN